MVWQEEQALFTLVRFGVSLSLIQRRTSAINSFTHLIVQQRRIDNICSFTEVTKRKAG
jgi:hypothetical protein